MGAGPNGDHPRPSAAPRPLRETEAAPTGDAWFPPGDEAAAAHGVWLIGDAAHPVSPVQGQGANCGLLDGVRLADFFARLPAAPAAAEELAGQVETELVERGGKFVLEPRKRARQHHTTSAFSQALRDSGFRRGTTMIKLFSRR